MTRCAFRLRPSFRRTLAACSSAATATAVAAVSLACIWAVEQPVDRSPESDSVAGMPDRTTEQEADRHDVFNANTDCTIVDPAIDAATASRHANLLPIVSEVHAGLMRIVEENGIASVQPDLVETYSVGDGGKEYRFVLRRGLKFSDGTPLRATDVKWSWQRAFRLAGTNGRARDVFGDIVGAQDLGARDGAHLTGVEIPDDRTVVVRLEVPRPDLPFLLADPVASVLSNENVSRWGFQFVPTSNIIGALTGAPDDAFLEDGVPVGAGPFRVVEYSPLGHPRQCVIERNPYFSGDGAKVSVVTYVNPSMGAFDPSVEPNDIESTAYLNNTVDYMLVSPETASNVASGDGNLKGSVRQYSSVPSTMFVLLNPSFPPLDDVNFRRALVAAADVATMFEPYPVRWQRRILPSAVATGFSTEHEVRFDPMDAKRGLLESKYRNGFDGTITLMVPAPNPEIDRLGTLVDRWASILGVTVVIEPAPANIIDEMSERGSVAARLIDAVPTYPDPHAIFRLVANAFGSREVSPEILEVEQLISIAAIEQDSARRAALHDEIESFLLEHALAIPLIVNWGGPYILTKPWVTGFELPRFPGSAFKSVTIDSDVREQSVPAN